MKQAVLHLLLFCLLAVQTACAQQESFRIVSYNCENFYDCNNDPLTEDDDFTPAGDKHWTPKRYKQKYIAIARALMAAGGWQGAALVGLCEVENSKVLHDLLNYTPLKNKDYAYVHYDSPDRRGVDVALLYRKDCFRVLESHPIAVSGRKKDSLRTRDILYVKGLTLENDTLFVLVCHAPSRLGGAQQSAWKRALCCKRLRQTIDSVLCKSAQAKVVVMGDFNDGPNDPSLLKTLGALPWEGTVQNKCLYNLSIPLFKQHLGSHKYQGEWEMLDQMIVSGACLNTEGFGVDAASFKVVNEPFLLEEDKSYLGQKPKRCYNGPAYHQGYSDHLPVVVDFYWKKEK